MVLKTIILEGCQFEYWPTEIKRFCELWNEGLDFEELAKYFKIQEHEVLLLVMHCSLEGLIEPRRGGLFGKSSGMVKFLKSGDGEVKKRKYKKRKSKRGD